jgi:CubicO group peptidase (beta-lactamase class C family)
LAWVLGAASSVWAQSKPPSDMDEYAARVLKTFDVPGLSVAIVKDGKLVFAKGYGV